MSPANAIGSTEVFDKLETKICEIYSATRRVVFGLGGLSGISLGVLSFFGMFRWSKFFVLAAGLMVVNLADMVVLYLVNGVDLSQCRADPDAALIANDAIFGQLNLAIDTTVNQIRPIVYGIAGFAAIALGTMAMFGRFAWSKFFGIIIGIGIIALVDSAIAFLVADAPNVFGGNDETFN